ncbi:MAG: MarR family transcriptional regulator [Gemmatimonadetes bacterium]|nr:MarR family transcriptional regulator [Gemmatimonadota bacterium]
MPRRDRQDPLPPGPELATRLHSAAIHLLRRLRVEDSASGLSAPRLSALSVIVFAGPVTLGDLARAEQVRAPTMSRLVSGLVKAGLVIAERDPADRRIQRIRATTKGRALLEAGRLRRVRRLARDLDRLSAAEFRVLREAVAMIERVARAER